MPRPPRRTRAAVSRTASSQAAAPAMIASKQQPEASTTPAPAVNSSTTKSKAGGRTRRGGSGSGGGIAATRGADASGLDVLDNDTFADLETNAGDASDLGGLDLDDLDDDLDAFGETAAGADATTGTHSTDTSSLFNVGLFRRGRPRQSSIHSRDDAPIRPSSRGPATPSLSATFNLGTFKRRRREPSILGANRRRHHRRDTSSQRHASRDRSVGSRNGDDDDAEVSGSELEGGVTAELEEPMLPSRPTATMRRSSLVSRSSVGAYDAAADDEAHVHNSSLSSVSNSMSVMLLARTRAKAASIKKRKSEEGQRRDDALPKRRATGTGTPFGSDAASSVLQSVEVPSSAAFSTPPRPSSLPVSEADRRRYATPGGPDDEVMAPPMSSGSEWSSPPMWPSLKALTHGPRRGGRAAAASAAVVPALPLSRETPDLIDDDDNASDISSPPSLTHSPNYRQARSRAASAKPRGRSGAQGGPSHARTTTTKKDVVPLTTAALTALLPQRRHRPRGGEDAWSASEEDRENGELERSALLSEDDDELAHYGGGSGRRGGLRRGRSAARAATAAAATTTTTRPTRAGQAPPSSSAGNRRQPAANGTANKAKGRAVRRTYGSRSFSSDKENEQADDDSTFAPLPDDVLADETATAAAAAGTEAPPKRAPRYFGEELEKAAKKFKEVDMWTLEYESVSRSSSPVGAR